MGDASDAFVMALENGAPIDRITFSSDGHGSMPRFDEKGRNGWLSSLQGI